MDVGSRKTRLIFASGGSEAVLEKTVMHVYVEVIEAGLLHQIKDYFLSKMSYKFVQCTHNKKKIYVNVNSLAKRFGIAPATIRSKANEKDGLVSLIDQHYASYLTTQEKINKYFNEIIELKYGGYVTSNTIKTKDKKDVLASDLYHAIGIAAFHGFKLETISQKGYLLKNKKILHLEKQKGSEWPLLTLFNNKVLGRGCFGKVQEVIELSKGRVSVAKIPYKESLFDFLAPVKNDDRVESVKNEYKVLEKIFSEGKVTGIQNKPDRSLDFIIENIGKDSHKGYITSKYDGDLRNAQLNDKEKLECIRQLLQGLTTLAEKKICHGDIKQSNCLFRKNEDAIECVIADFGGARDISTRISLPRSYVALFSKHYVSSLSKLIKEIEQFKNKHNIEGKRKSMENLREFLLREDVYAMGMLIDSLFKNYQFKDDKEKNLFKRILADMRNEDWSQRITASNALDRYNNIFPVGF